MYIDSRPFHANSGCRGCISRIVPEVSSIYYPQAAMLNHITRLTVLLKAFCKSCSCFCYTHLCHCMAGEMNTSCSLLEITNNWVFSIATSVCKTIGQLHNRLAADAWQSNSRPAYHLQHTLSSHLCKYKYPYASLLQLPALWTLLIFLFLQKH